MAAGAYHDDPMSLTLNELHARVCAGGGCETWSDEADDYVYTHPRQHVCCFLRMFVNRASRNVYWAQPEYPNLFLEAFEVTKNYLEQHADDVLPPSNAARHFNEQSRRSAFTLLSDVLKNIQPRASEPREDLVEALSCVAALVLAVGHKRANLESARMVYETPQGDTEAGPRYGPARELLGRVLAEIGASRATRSAAKRIAAGATQDAD